jgi:hypothetical protein
LPPPARSVDDRRVTRRPIALGVAIAAAASVMVSAPAAAAPIVTLEGPVEGCCTNQRRPAITGLAGTSPGISAVTVQVFQGEAVDDAPELTLTAQPDASGRYEAIPEVDLADGPWTARASQTDTTGVGTSEPLTFVVDTVAPTPTITSPADGVALPIPTPTITGRAGTAASDLATVHVVIRGRAGEQSLMATVDAAGAFRVDALSLPDGNYGVSVSQSDVAGNGATSVESGFSIDTKAPNTTIEAGPVPVAGGTRTVQVGFGANELSTYRCELDGEALAACEPPVLVLRGLKRGRHELVITAVDPAGNADPTPARVAFSVDLVRPKVTLVAPALLPTRGGETRVVLKCLKGKASGPCVGQIVVQRGGSSLLVKPARFSVAAGKKAQIKLFLNGRGQDLLFKNGRVRVQLVLVAADGRGNVGRRILRRTLVLGG